MSASILAAAIQVNKTEAWVTIGLFFVLWVVVGAVLKRFVITEEDQLLAGRNVGDALGIMTVMAAWITTGTILGTSEMAWGFGIVGIIAIMLAGGPSMLLMGIFAPRIQALMPNGRTIGDFFRLRFDKKNYYLFLPMTVIWDIGFLMSLALGAGIVLETLFNIPYHQGVIVTIGVCIVYVALAQMVSVIANDWIQGMLVMLLVVVAMSYVMAKTGISNLFDAAKAKDSALVSFKNGPALLAAGALMMYGIGSVFMDNTWWSRVWAIRRPRRTFVIAGLGWMTIALLSGLSAFVAIYRHIEISQPNQVFPKVMLEFLPTGGALIALLVMYAAIASSVAAILWAVTSLVLVDGYKQFVNPNPSKRRLTTLGAVITVVLGIAVVGLVWNKPLTVQTLLVLFGIVTGAYIFPVTMGLYWRRTNEMGAFLGVAAAVAVGAFVYYGLDRAYLYQAVILSAVVGFVVILAFTLVRPREFDWRALRESRFEDEVPSAGAGEPVARR